MSPRGFSMQESSGFIYARSGERDVAMSADRPPAMIPGTAWTATDMMNTDIDMHAAHMHSLPVGFTSNVDWIVDM